MVFGVGLRLREDYVELAVHYNFMIKNLGIKQIKVVE
jgi:hypothetical protein